MEVVFGLIGVTVVLLVVIVVVLLWAIRSGQFEDMEGPAWRVVMDDDRVDPDANASAELPAASSSSRSDEHAQADATNDSDNTPKT